MKRAADGDTEAFGRLVRAHQRRLVRFAARMLGDAEAAEDAAQEALLSLWRMRARYQPQCRLSCLLIQIVRNICLDYARVLRPETGCEARAEEPAQESIEQRVQAAALAQAVRQAVLDLP